MKKRVQKTAAPAKTQPRARQSTRKPAEAKKPQMVALTIKTTRWGKDDPTFQKIEVPVDGSEKVRLELTINVRETDFVEVRPVRRAMTDVKGLVKDAARLANSF